MSKLKRVFVFGLLLGVLADLGSPELCNTPEEDAERCKNVQKSFDETGFFGDYETSYLKNLAKDITKISTTCAFDTTNDATIAESFKFILFKPNSAKPKYINGIDLLIHKCKALKSGARKTKKTIWLWPGWMSNCSIAENFIGGDHYYEWTMDHAPRLAKRVNAQVIAIDWGSNQLSCCNYKTLVFCHTETISEWMAKVIETCSTIAPSTSISNTWLIGHSLGAQFVGYTANVLQTGTSRVQKVIGLDPAGLYFGFLRKCHGIQKEYADVNMIFITNPGRLGTKDTNSDVVNVFVNKEKKFLQPGCAWFDHICNHRYANEILLKALADGKHIRGTKLTNANQGPIYNISIYEKMQPGLYNVESDDNPILQI